MLWIIFRAGWATRAKTCGHPSRVCAIIDDLFILLARCTLLHHHFPLALYLSVRLQPASALFQRGLFIFYPSPPFAVYSTLSRIHGLPHYSPQTQVCILPTRLARAAFHLEKSMRFPFHRKQQLLNIFIHCLIILRRSSFRDRATPRIFTILICCILLLLPEISIQELRKSRNVSMIL